MSSEESQSLKSSKPRWLLRRWLIVVSLILICALLTFFLLRRGKLSPWISGTMAPGAATALKAALGTNALERVTQIISPGNRPSIISAGTHLQSGVAHGQPYGLAFDIAILPGTNPDADTRKLRLQGIVAWHRGPGAPGGPAGLGAHIHCVWPGAETHNRQNLEQISSFVHHYRGLADRSRPKHDWFDPSIREDEIARVTQVYERYHGKGSLSKVPTYDALHGR